MVSNGVISCAYRLFGRLPPEAHSDLPMMFHETVVLITRGVTGTHGHIKVNLCKIYCVCPDYMTNRGLRMGLVVVVIGHAGGKWRSVNVRGGEQYAEMGGGAGNRIELHWRQNQRTKRRLDLQIEKAAWGLGAATWRVTEKELLLYGNQGLSEENTSLTQAFLLSLPLEITDNSHV